MRLVSLLLLIAGLAFSFDRDGNYTIRFEPMAILQSGVPIPFHIKVEDARHQALPDAKVTLQIETADHKQVQLFKATAIGAGVYSAKPIFPESGEWLVLVEVHRNDAESARSITFEVADSQR